MRFSSNLKLYDPIIPNYLHDRPQWFIKHCMQQLHGAKRVIPKEISRLHTNTFVVQQREKYYTVNLGDDQKFPTCECLDFHQYYLPCKHFFIVFEQVPGYSWESLATYFRNSPLISILMKAFPPTYNTATLRK